MRELMKEKRRSMREMTMDDLWGMAIVLVMAVFMLGQLKNK